MKEKQNHELKTEKEATEYLRCSSVTTWRLRKEGRLPFYRIAGKVLYDQSDLDNFLNKNKREAFGVAA